MTDTEAPAPRGHNRPPIVETLKDACDDLAARLPVEFADIIKRTAELKDAFANVPEVVTDDIAGDVSDQIAQITAHAKAAEALRTAAVSPVLSAQRVINSWFDSNCFDDLDVTDKKRKPGAKQVLLARLTVYQQKKAAEEQRRRDDEARKAREAAEAAERARLDAERVAREAREAEERRIAEEQRRVREAEEAERRRRAEEDRKAREAAEADARAIKDAADLDEAIKREEVAKVERAKREAAEAERRRIADAEAAERAKKAEEDAAVRRLQAEADEAAAKERADKAAAEAALAAEQASAKASKLHQTRGNFGSSSSLATETKGFITDRNLLLGAAADLWPFMSDDDLQKALNAYVKTHKTAKQLPGAEIREITAARVRG